MIRHSEPDGVTGRDANSLERVRCRFELLNRVRVRLELLGLDVRLRGDTSERGVVTDAATPTLVRIDQAKEKQQDGTPGTERDPLHPPPTHAFHRK